MKSYMYHLLAIEILMYWGGYIWYLYGFFFVTCLPTECEAEVYYSIRYLRSIKKNIHIETNLHANSYAVRN